GETRTCPVYWLIAKQLPSSSHSPHIPAYAPPLPAPKPSDIFPQSSGRCGSNGRPRKDSTSRLRLQIDLDLHREHQRT
ncbi:MAG: hypothetical protein ACK53Y_09055, partial [bacterium]